MLSVIQLRCTNWWVPTKGPGFVPSRFNLQTPSDPQHEQGSNMEPAPHKTSKECNGSQRTTSSDLWHSSESLPVTHIWNQHFLKVKLYTSYNMFECQMEKTSGEGESKANTLSRWRRKCGRMSDERWKTFPQWTACQAPNEGPKWQVPKVLCKTVFLTRRIEEKENKTKTKKGKWGENVTLPSSMAFFAIP